MRAISCWAGGALVAGLIAGACGDGGEAGALCRIDSDCGDGLLCALDGRCRTRDAVADAFVVHHDVEVVSVTDGTEASDVEASGECAPPVVGAFAAATPPCPTAPLVKKVTNLQLAEEGHGLEQLAAIANQVLQQSFANDEQKLALWVDGSLATGCPRALAWVRDAQDVNADCTPVHTDTMPFEVPNLVHGTIEGVVFDPAKNEVRGRVDKEALVESLAPELRSVAESLIYEDVDTDGDHVPDRASVIILLTF